MTSTRKREIFIRIEQTPEIVDIFEKLREKQEKINALLKEYDKLTLQENKLFENWNNYLEEINQKLEHITL